MVVGLVWLRMLLALEGQSLLRLRLAGLCLALLGLCKALCLALLGLYLTLLALCLALLGMCLALLGLCPTLLELCLALPVLRPPPGALELAGLRSRIGLPGSFMSGE